MAIFNTDSDPALPSDLVSSRDCSETPLSWNEAADMARLSRELLSAVIEHGRRGAVEEH